MKLCWEFLDNLRLTSPTHGEPKLAHYYGVPRYRLSDGSWEYKEHCLYCGSPYLGRRNHNSKFCDIDCRKLYTKWCKEERKLIKQVRNRYKIKKRRAYKKTYNNKSGWKWSVESRQKLKELKNSPEYIASISGPRNPVWKGGISKTNKTSYYAVKDRLPKHIEIRQDPLNCYVLQTKCMQCGGWFSPNGKLTNKKLIGKKPLNFFCSVECSINYHRKKWNKKKVKILTIKTSMYNGLVKRSKELRKVNRKIKMEQKRKFNKIKQIELKKEKIVYNQKYGKMTIKRKLKKQLIEEFKKYHPNRYVKYKHSNVGLWFEIKRWQDPSDWRITRMLVMSKSRSKELNLKFNIDKEWCRKRIYKCEATNMKFDNSYEGTFIVMNPYAPSIDRIDNTKGYTKNNCRLVLTMFNSLKSTLTDEELYINLKKFVIYYKKTYI